MRIDEPSLEWILTEVGLRWHLKKRPTTAYQIAALCWSHSYTPAAAAAEVGVSPATAQRYLRRLKSRIRAHRATLDTGEAVSGVMDQLLEDGDPFGPGVREHARHLLGCVRNRQGTPDHGPVLSKNCYRGEWEEVPLNAQVCSVEDAERIVSDLAWARGRGRTL